MKLINLLKEVRSEGVTVDNGGLKIDIIKSTDKPDDPFLINRGGEFFKKKGVAVFYGISPNPEVKMPESQITAIYDSVKKQKINDEELRKLVLLTAPRAMIDNIVVLPSSSGLNKKIAEILKNKYKVSDDRVFYNISKVKYKIDDMIDQEKFAKSDPTTQKMASTWIRSLKKKYGEDAELYIKKSSDPDTGHPGIQSGARILLKPTYNVGQVPKNGLTVIVDDFLISGSSLGEVINSLLADGMNKETLAAYCLGIKR